MNYTEAMVIFQKATGIRMSNPQFRLRHNRLPILKRDDPLHLISKVWFNFKELQRGSSIVYNVRKDDWTVEDYVVRVDGNVLPFEPSLQYVREVIDYACSTAGDELARFHKEKA